MKIGFIDYYLDEWHANQYPALLREVSGGALEVAYAWALEDEPPGRMGTDQWCQTHGVTRCGDIAEVVARSDALVVLSPDHCHLHEQLCQLPLASGKNTYVDKTFAPDRACAQRLFALAQAHGTPCYSTSALRCAQEYEALRDTQVYAAASIGPNGFDTYAIHQLEPLTLLMGASARRVMAVKTQPGAGINPWSTLVIEYQNGKSAVLTCTGGDAPFLMQLCTADGNKTVRVESDFFRSFMVQLAGFLQTGRVPVPAEQTIAIMALREAGLRALEKPGTWVQV